SGLRAAALVGRSGVRCASAGGLPTASACTRASPVGIAATGIGRRAVVAIAATASGKGAARGETDHEQRSFVLRDRQGLVSNRHVLLEKLGGTARPVRSAPSPNRQLAASRTTLHGPGGCEMRAGDAAHPMQRKPDD